jgi:hypothetical protein
VAQLRVALKMVDQLCPAIGHKALKPNPRTNRLPHKLEIVRLLKVPLSPIRPSFCAHKLTNHS